MTKVFQDIPYSTKGPQELNLETALTPEEAYEGGVSERAVDNARKGLECLGRLTALLVEKQVLTLGEASRAMDIYPRLYWTADEADRASDEWDDGE